MAKFNSTWLLRKRQFHALTGVEPDIFQQMVERMRPGWQHQIIEPKNRDGRPWGVGGLEEHLLVLLIVYRCCVTQDFIGCLYQVDKSAICRALQRVEPLAAQILGVKRSIKVSSSEAEALIIDCTEQPIQRPLRHQRRWYSGKKKRHTIKTEIIITEHGRFVSTSKPAPGRVPDITVRRRGTKLPKGSRAHADSGYQGLQHDHPDVDIPYKKSKKKPLTKDERAYNGALSRFRVRVEHSIAKLKSYRMLSERYRYPKATYAAKFSIIAGVINIAAGF
jgi:IS5 family transposase